MNSPNPYRQVDHIAVVVRDTAEALRFYRDVLGLAYVVFPGNVGGPEAVLHLVRRLQSAP